MENKITIGLFIDTYYPMVDGVITVVDNYARRLSNMANVIVFAPEFHGKKFDDSKLPYKIVRCKSMKAPVIDYSLPIPDLDPKFRRELNKYHLDIVHIHSPFMVGKAGIEYAKKHHVPVVGTMHSQFKQDLKRAVKMNSAATLLNNTIIKTFDKCDQCWAVNSEVARIFYEDYGYKELPEVMNNATEMEKIEDVKKAHQTINSLYNINPKDKVFLFVGRINKLKNIFFIVDALKALKEKKPNLSFKMLFVGSGQDDEKLKEVIEDENMKENIILCGKVTDKQLLAAHYCRADLFLFPSLYDASSIVQIEAASQSTPSIFLKGAATAATITDNVNGFLSENSVDAYANKIIEVLKDKKLYEEVSQNAYKDLYKNWDMVIEDVYKRYCDLIKKKKAQARKKRFSIKLPK